MTPPARSNSSSSFSKHSIEDAEKSAQAAPVSKDDGSAFGPAPDGGTTAWLNAFGGFCIFFGCLGFTSCFGVLQEYYGTHQLKNYSASDIAWIGSVSNFIQFSGGAISGSMFDRFGINILRVSAILYIFGLMMTSLCTEYYQFMLAQGLVMGSAVACLQFPAFAIVAQYFDKKRAAAMGITASGSSIGGIIFPLILSKLLNGSSIGFGWSIRIIGFIILPFFLLAIMILKPRVPPRKANIFIGAAWKDIKYCLLIAGMFFMMMGMWTPIFYMPSYAVSRGMGVTLAGNLLAIINATSTLGRIIPGILADKFGKLNIFGLAGIATGIMVFCFDEPKTNAGLIIYVIFFGFTSGAIISSASVAISLCAKDPRNLGTYMGMGMGLAAFATLAGPPISGALLERYGGYSQVAIFGGTFCVFGGLVVFSSKFVVPEGIMGKV
ncbi:hypothetical protein HBI70_182400 [Parastagonospora nodorum]|nr:hypothetical protein HBH52_208400 [Parastagonospora nodorum]KAH4114508.1 hypothetical protein HBH47_195330 [Parastagonospora nodorum]KAH4845779.1 hypothetical protein HBH75_177790 [Parastagonospora nodorum]KAH4924883.1 hypothetical protein HBI79_156460 [Parastagonospora nodorum]KAH5067459.1 hypothetical protein HBH95_197370 [Parastagonospora nodorum]